MAVGTVGKKALEAINELVRRGVSPNEIYRKTGYKRGIDGNWAVPAAVGVGAAGQSEETEAGLIQSAVRKAFPGVKVDLREQGDNLIVDRIVVPEADREKGVGSAVIGMINDIADKEGKQVALTPSSDFGGNKKRLESFYKRMGFVPNKGRSRDLSVSESMIRPLAFGGVGLTGLAASPDSAMAASGEPKRPTAFDLDARYGELGMVPNDGRISTEFSFTEYVPELGGWVNIPTLVKGQKDIERMLSTGDITNENAQIAIDRAIERKRSGAMLPAYRSLDEAVEAAKSRTEEEKMRPYGGLRARVDKVRPESTGTIEAPAAPWLVDAANYMRRLELPIVGRPLEGLADWAEGAAYQDPDRLKRAAIGALDLM